MLARRKQEWDFQVEEKAPEVSAQAQEVRPSRQLRTRFFALILLFAVMAMILTFQSSLIVKNGYEVVKLKSDVVKMEKENEFLQLDIARMKSPQRIQAIATKDLGMVAPQTIYHASGVGTKKVSGTATAQQQSTGSGTYALNKAETTNGIQ
ncbi:MAG: cell division protein FtsL [Firmicutes bacterium]|nr:cell division protein FtsL [Bacillota bacterium]